MKDPANDERFMVEVLSNVPFWDINYKEFVLPPGRYVATCRPREEVTLGAKPSDILVLLDTPVGDNSTVLVFSGEYKLIDPLTLLAETAE